MSMPVFGERIRETSTTTGTGTFDLDGAVDNCQTFADGLPAGTDVPVHYAIIHRSVNEFEVGRGKVTDYNPSADQLTREKVFASSNSGSLVDFSAGTKDVISCATGEIAKVPPTATNLCMNPGFETILPGTHTSAIKNLTGSETDQNCQFPGWKIVTTNASDDITVDEETTNVSDGSKRALKVSVATVGGNGPRLGQWWTSGEGGIDHWAIAAKQKYFTIAADVKLSAGTADACRLYVEYTGAGGTTVYSEYKANDTDYERLIKSALIPAGVTGIKFGVQFKSATPDYYIDNAMVLITEGQLKELDYVPRPPIQKRLYNYGSSTALSYTTPADTNFHETGDGTADTDVDYNDDRPAWATHAILHCRGQNGAAGHWAAVRPSGESAYQYIKGDAVNSWRAVTLAIGQDGQFEYKASVTSVDLEFRVAEYIGEGL